MTGENEFREAAVTLPWRTGRHNPRTIYATPADDLSGDGVFIGALDTAEIAAEAVAAHNYRLAMSRGVVHQVLCRHCGEEIIRCGGTTSDPACKGWLHAGYESQPIGRHYCGGRSVNPSAEPASG